MLILLPPSETKRLGGADGSSLELSALSFPQLTAERRAAIRALRALSSNVANASVALKVGEGLRAEVLRNRELTTSPVMAALDRYTGVLFDALDAVSLAPAARDLAGATVAVHSALFGLVKALDPIPAYRLSHDSRLATLPLRRHWSASISRALLTSSGPVFDLRSEGYVRLGPVPDALESVYIRVVAEGADGRRRALNHFNKQGKGLLVRAILDSGIDHPSVDSLLEWAAASDVRLTRGVPGELELVTDQVMGARTHPTT